MKLSNSFPIAQNISRCLPWLKNYIETEKIPCTQSNGFLFIVKLNGYDGIEKNDFILEQIGIPVYCKPDGKFSCYVQFDNKQGNECLCYQADMLTRNNIIFQVK